MKGDKRPPFPTTFSSRPAGHLARGTPDAERLLHVFHWMLPAEPRSIT